MKSNAEREMYYAVLDAQEKERQLISQDIHDELGGFITSAKLTLAGISSETFSEGVSESLEHLNEVLEMASVAAKNASNALTPAAIKRYGLKGAILDVQDRYKKSALQFDISYNSNFELSEFTQINLYRIINEAVNNSVKYAHANCIFIRVESISNSLKIFIGDDGDGFEIDKIRSSKKTNGLNNIENRCALLQAELSIKSSPNNGCSYTILLRQ